LSIAPGSAVGNAGYRTLMACAAARLALRDDRAARAVATALRTTASGRIPAAERAWIDRIDAHREALAGGGITALAAAHPRGLDAPEQTEEAAQALQWMSLPPILATLLMRIVRELQPQRCLELGSGFGISTSYQAAALELNERGSMVSLDVEGMTRIAEPSLAQLGLGRASFRPGQIEATLDGAVAEQEPVDYAFLDADHTRAGTVSAFEQIVERAANTAVLALDDINWTDEMRASWRDVRAHPRVSAAVAVRRLGSAIIGSRS